MKTDLATNITQSLRTLFSGPDDPAVAVQMRDLIAKKLEYVKPWRTDDPPKDGTVIVALGNLTEDCGDGMFNVEPFTDSISWDGEEWVNWTGLAVGTYADAEVTIHHWMPLPENASADLPPNG